MTLRPQNLRTSTDELLAVARRCAGLAAAAIRSEFGIRHIVERRGAHDVQLGADIQAHEFVLQMLTAEYPQFGIVSEEGSRAAWETDGPIWVVDPLDGTNNFGYGIAHCAVIISLFIGERVELSVVNDPLLGREFFATSTRPFVAPQTPSESLASATISLVSGYSDDARSSAWLVEPGLRAACKRVLSLWAPGLDLALVADGQIDGMICISGDLLDICGGAFLVQSAGGCVLDLSGQDLDLCRSMHAGPVTFVAARSRDLAARLRQLAIDTGSGE